MSKKYIISNWKMLPQSLAEAQEILDSTSDFLSSRDIHETTLVFCPPFVFIEEVSKLLNSSGLSGHAFLGAQDISVEDEGETSGPMLRKLGVQYVIVGHSDRRWKLNEPAETVNQRLKAVLRNELIPIVCIGERERNDGFGEFLKQQVRETFEGLSADEVEKCFIAYEPVWAISTSPGAKPDTPESALESISIIRDELKLNFGTSPEFFYGGSVNSRNIREFLFKDFINGVLVGGASVEKEELVKMLSTISKR